MRDSIIITLTFLLLLFGMSSHVRAQEDAPRPIHVVIEIHCDPMWFGSPSLQEVLYDEWVVAVDEALDEAEAHGARISFLSTGQFMEWVLEKPESGFPLIERLHEHGDQIGTHLHNRTQVAPFVWVDTGATSEEEIEALWDSHVAMVDEVVEQVLGVTDPAAVRAINDVLGAHVPNDDTLRIDMLEDYGFVGHEQGPEEIFTSFFDHYAMNPWRPARDGILRSDLDGPVVLVPFGPVLGKNEVHFGVLQDMRLPAFKARFLMELLNWLHDIKVTGNDRIWVTGWAAHCHDVIEGTSTRDAWEPLIAWLDDTFVDIPVGGHDAGVFSTIKEVRTEFLEWEAENPGADGFDYQPLEADWSAYPYLVGAVRYLAQAEHVVDLPPSGPIRMHRLLSSEEADAFDLHVVYTTHGNGVIADLSLQLGVSEIAVVDTRRGTWEVVPATSVPIVPQGAILVAPEDALAITMFGDLNADGRINGADLAVLLAEWNTSGADSDLDGNGTVEGADLSMLLGNWTG